MGDMEEMDLKARALLYFQRFSLKDINGLADMFANNIWLEDWENEARGKAEVLGINQQIFDNVLNIIVSPGYLYQEDYIVTATLLIWVYDLNNNLEIIKVCDIIEFDYDGKIKSIRAYKG